MIQVKTRPSLFAAFSDALINGASNAFNTLMDIDRINRPCGLNAAMTSLPLKSAVAQHLLL